MNKPFPVVLQNDFHAQWSGAINDDHERVDAEWQSRWLISGGEVAVFDANHALSFGRKYAVKLDKEGRDPLVKYPTMFGNNSVIHYPALVGEKKALTELNSDCHMSHGKTRLYAHTALSLPMYSFLFKRDITPAVDACNSRKD